ncbi:MAG: hypothetical protein QOE90_2565 [Thermoplasmata archaeon]|jgi:uncharacterized protein (DUF697 family)|nr:hypothetical protein [Thermoplasmata archaeon]
MIPADLHRRTSGPAMAWGLLVALVVLGALGFLAARSGWSAPLLILGAGGALAAIVAGSWVLMMGR